MRSAIDQNGFLESVHTTKTLCNGRYCDGSIVISEPSGIWFKGITAGVCEDFVKFHIVEGTVPEAYKLYAYGDDYINSDEVAKIEKQL